MAHSKRRGEVVDWADLLGEACEVNKPAPIPAGWKTAKELSKLWKLAPCSARRNLSALIRLGKVERQAWKLASEKATSRVFIYKIK